MGNTRVVKWGILRWFETMDNSRMVESRISQCLGQMNHTGERINADRLLNDHSEDRERETVYYIWILFVCFT
jgi:hypothetical protein